MKSMEEWGQYIDDWCSRKGWNNSLILGNAVCNLHTEISEAWEEIRNGRSITEIYESDGGKPEGFGVELADLLIRVFHLTGHYGINIEELIEKKMAYNEKRPYRHGGKKA